MDWTEKAQLDQLNADVLELEARRNALIARGAPRGPMPHVDKPLAAVRAARDALLEKHGLPVPAAGGRPWARVGDAAG